MKEEITVKKEGEGGGRRTRRRGSVIRIAKEEIERQNSATWTRGKIQTKTTTVQKKKRRQQQTNIQQTNIQQQQQQQQIQIQRQQEGIRQGTIIAQQQQQQQQQIQIQQQQQQQQGMILEQTQGVMVTTTMPTTPPRQHQQPTTSVIQRLQEEQHYQRLWNMTRDMMGNDAPRTKGLPVKAVGPIKQVNEAMPAIGIMHEMAEACVKQGDREAALYYAAMNMMYQGGSIELFQELIRSKTSVENNVLEVAWMTVVTNSQLVHTMPYIIMARNQKDYNTATAMVTLLIKVVPKNHNLYKKALLIKGDMCIHGQWQSEKKDDHLRTAIDCFQESIHIDTGCARAYFCLGLCYSRQHKLQDAFQNYQQAAALGHAGAMNNLGYYYEHHRKDPKGAAYWYEASAAHESPIGMCNAGIFILQQIENLEGEQKQAHYLKALHYFETSAAAGHVFAMTMVAEMHRNGYGVPVSYKKAFNYYHQAANHGDRAAMTAIGFLYYTGSPPNLPLAFEYFSKASEAGDASAYYNLAIMYEQGIPDFLQPDVDHAKHLFERSASMGYAPANAALGNVFWRRAMQDNNTILMQKARVAYEAAIQQGFTRATVHLTLLTETMLKEQCSLGFL